MPGVTETTFEEAIATVAASFKAGKKSSTCWIATPGNQPRLVWAAWITNAICLVTGGGEQEVPGLLAGGSVAVTVASAGATVLIATATVELLNTADDGWPEIAAGLAERRLNGAGTPDELIERWAAEATIARLTVTTGTLPRL